MKSNYLKLALFRRRVRVIRARFDRRLLSQRPDVRAALTERGLRHPGLREQHVLRFPRILMEVVDTRQPVIDRTAEHGILLFQVHLPVAPLHAPDVVAHVDDQSLTVGFLLFAHREQVHLVHDLVARHAGG